MAMTLRLDENDTDALRVQAAKEGRSMQHVAQAAIREYVDRRATRADVDEALQVLGPRFSGLMQRLRDA